MEQFTLIGTIVVVILSITTHEAAHAWVADRLGDPTARSLGRVTLNPLPHIDLFMTILLPGLLLLSHAPFLFGGAKPVPVNIRRLRNPPRDWALVGIAGPASNLVLAFGMAALLSIFLHSGLFEARSVGSSVLFTGIQFNVLLILFNLIPIPPLDGSRVVMYVLHRSGNREALAAYVGLERIGIFLLLGVIYFIPSFQSYLVGGIQQGTAFLLGLVGL